MITERNESESDEILRKVSRGRDLVADVTNDFTRRFNAGRPLCLGEIRH